MSNYLAFATVSATIGMIVSAAMQQTKELSAAASVTYGPPKEVQPHFVGANLFMYQISPNANLRNQDLPMRNRQADLIQQPIQAFDLFYMLTFYGDESRLEPQRLMGAALNALEMNTVLSRDLLYEVTQIPGNEYLRDSDLYKQLDHISLESITLSVEDIFRLWSSFTSAKYHVSIFYKVSVVVLMPDVSVEEAFIATTVNIVPASSAVQLVLNTIVPQRVPYTPTAQLTFQLDKLRDGQVVAWFGSEISVPQIKSPTELIATLPSNLQPGAISVWLAQVITNEFGHRIIGASNRQSFVLQPIIRNLRFDALIDPRSSFQTPESMSTSVISLCSAPDVGYLQPVKLLLNGSPQYMRYVRNYGISDALRFTLPSSLEADLETLSLSSSLINAFKRQGFELDANATVTAYPDPHTPLCAVIDDAYCGAYYRIDDAAGGLVVYGDLPYGASLASPPQNPTPAQQQQIRTDAEHQQRNAPIDCDIPDENKYNRVTATVPPATVATVPLSDFLFTLPAEFATSLQNGSVGAEMLAAFSRYGRSLWSQARVTMITQPLVRNWVIRDTAHQQIYRINKVADALIVYYMLPDDHPEERIAFAVPGVANGQYLVRLQIDNLSACESQLEQDSTHFYSAPLIQISQPSA